MLSKRFKNLVSVILVITFMVGLNSNIFGTEGKISDENIGSGLLPDDYITIYLKDDNTATVTTNEGTFDIKYKKSMDRMLVGNGLDNDLLKILYSASKISKIKYDLYINPTKNESAIYDEKKFFSMAIVEHELQSNGIITLEEIFKTTYSFDSYLYSVTEKIKDIKSIIAFQEYGICDKRAEWFSPSEYTGYPYLSSDGKSFEYYLPLRFIFENFGFNVSWAKEDKTIKLEYYRD